MFDLVLGTNNAKKLVELQMMMPAGMARLTTLADIKGSIDVVEDGTTFAENAAKKATEQALHLGRWVLAEDSGLTVDALKGAPGVYSARYAGEHGNDAANNEKLLDELKGLPAEKRDAQFNCHLCLSDPEGQVRLTASGICRGRIGESLSGAAGFGYDPLFIIREYHRTFGELDLAVKRAISHRSRGLRILIPKLSALIANVGG
ncbi:RdgB/HAM1 family non-canonical purine NTP pyrophosphatase [Aporhodopirellula aestuarii]|uniref:dITP/XTP pyrophosphatase n=1 Tax=Aporhodopirellula aestuarii TaxID=2950107 RepID=A0ABT0U537_9BACT|nr:RdgB/HAM1 family non-canonical purine NTP pyrophosphatase [Aporhodopirellula aestuarii]MCM2372018.1 RdgB/HAM1 family non-canonical purine NTP pyrophosphatase [Aporhodopirellula aestuarii]